MVNREKWGNKLGNRLQFALLSDLIVSSRLLRVQSGVVKSVVRLD